MPLPADARVVDVRDFSIVPGFVDAHTHAIYAGDRRPELRRRLAGETYASIAASGGGIVSTVTATRAASEEDLIAETRPRLDSMLACGTTTCEIKSGYGLDLESELKMLRAIARIGESHPVDVVATFMGAHEIPREHRGNRDAYVDIVVNDMIPAVAAAKLASWCDVFCETGVFTPEESRRILQAGSAAGLQPRIHADELGASGGSLVAAAVGARSADHLIFVPDDGIAAMARANVTATLLPAAAFYLKLGTICAGAGTHRGRCRCGAGDRRQSRRRILFVHALRDGAGMFRHGFDVRRSADRGYDQRRLVARPRQRRRQPGAGQTG